jgi:hypothetical protein
MGLSNFFNRVINSLKNIFKKSETNKYMPIVEINFKCDHCRQEFWGENFNIAAFLYGVFLLLGQEKEYVGLTCPNCIKTILIKDNSDLVDYTKQNLSLGEMSFPIYLVRDKDDDPDYSHGLIPFSSKLRYHSSVNYDPVQIPEIKDFNIIDWSGRLTNNLEVKLDYYMGENPQLQEKYLCPYIPYGEPPIGPYFSIWWFREDQIDDLVKIENDEELRIFPRYVHKISEIENIDRFCWNYYLPEGQINGDKTRLPSDLVDILTAEPSPWELPILNLSSYEFLWKTPHPFEYKGVPRGLIDVDPAQFQKPKKSFPFDEIAGEVRGYFEKGYGLNYINDNYEAYIKDYIELAQRSSFSYALVWELKLKYLELLYKAVKIDASKDAPYSIFKQGEIWTIKFNEKSLQFVDKMGTAGYKYIQYLLKYPEEAFLTKKLDILISTPQSSEDKHQYQIAREDFTEMFGALDGETKGKQLSDEEKEKLALRINELKEYYQEIKKYENFLEAQEKGERVDVQIDFDPAFLKEAKTRINEFIREYKNRLQFGGQILEKKEEDKKAQQRISKAIERAVKEIKKHDEEIFNHFLKALSPINSKYQCYNLDKDIEWFT